MSRKKPFDGRRDDEPSDLELRKEEERRRLEAKVDLDMRELETSGVPDAYLIREFFRALNGTMTITAAVAACGFSRRRVKAWEENVPGFKDLLDDYIKVQRLERLEESLYQRAVDTSNPTGAAAAMFILKGRDRATFGEKLEVDTRVTVQHVIQTADAVQERQRERLKAIQERQRALPAQTGETVQDAAFTTVEVDRAP